MTGMTPANVLAHLRHCSRCEVEWPATEGDDCWVCLEPGVHGKLPASLVTAPIKARPHP